VGHQKIKPEIIEKILLILSGKLENIQAITEQSRQDVIHGDMKQEGKYDTRAIEAGYLAGAQKKRLEILELEIEQIKNLELESSPIVVPGSLVKVTQGNDFKNYFVTFATGGFKVLLSNKTEIIVISSVSPVGKSLSGKKNNDFFEFKTPKTAIELEILEIN